MLRLFLARIMFKPEIFFTQVTVQRIISSKREQLIFGVSQLLTVSIEK
jgi:hypothetical protein